MFFPGGEAMISSFVAAGTALALAQNALWDPATMPAEELQEIHDDAARDLKAERIYNRAGATRADYNAAWQECRLIARGARAPHQNVYVPAGNAVSPIAAGIAGGVGSAIGSAIAEGQMRRESRRNCMKIRGWTLVEFDKATEARLERLDDSARAAEFDRLLGAETLPASAQQVTWQNEIAAPPIAAEEFE